jgi:dTDP-4-dehydrorhamnose 3,5-epimerase
MAITSTDFPGLFLFEPAVFNDDRGYFFESYNEKFFQQSGVDLRFVQDNQSHSIYGVVRGLHYQLPPHSQSKLVRVLIGRILDVVVDLREGSPAFGKAFSIELSAENKKQLFVPRGFAHGFAVLSDTADIMYKCDSFYNKESEAGICFNDPDLAIDWGVPSDKISVSVKDLELPVFRDCKKNFVFGPK